jgi:hypothetical protein
MDEILSSRDVTAHLPTSIDYKFKSVLPLSTYFAANHTQYKWQSVGRALRKLLCRIIDIPWRETAT